MSEETETVTVNINIPEGIMRFLKDIIPSTSYESVEEYLADAVVSRVEGDIDGDVFAPTIKNVAERYNLKEEFEIKE